MAESKVHTLLISTPPDDVDDVHALLASVWRDSPHVLQLDRISFETALIELASNVIRHADSGQGVTATLTIEVSSNRIEANLRDTGKPGNVELVNRSMPTDLSETGRGIPLIQALVDELNYERDGNHNHWQIIRRIQTMTADAESNPSKGAGGVTEEQSEATRQRALDSMNILDTPPEERFDQVTRLAKQLFGVESAAITLIDRDRQWFKSRIGIDLAETPRTVAFCNTTIQDSKLMTVPNALADPRFSENPLVTGDPNIRFYAGYPLEGPGGERLGALCVFDPSPRELSGVEADLLRELAHWVQTEMMAGRDLQRARDVQRGLLPKQLVSLRGYQVAADCVPAHAVGGDFYDWYPVAGGAVFTLADVMGKGIGAAIIAATVRAVLRSSSWHEGETLGLERACQSLNPDLEEAGIFVTLFQSRLDVETGVLRYVDAGHGLTLVVRGDGRTDRLATTSFPLGTGITETWIEETVTLDPGDTLVALSDGVLDLFDGSLGSLDEVANIVRSASSAQAVVDTIVAMASTALASDDVSLLVVRRSE